MKHQSFRLIIRVDAEVETHDGKTYLTEARVRRRIENLLKEHNLIEKMPCHGKASIIVADCLQLPGGQ